MTDLLLVAPVLIPLAAGAALTAMWGRWPMAGKGVAVSAAIVVFALALYMLLRVRDEGILVTNLGDWPAPFGIVFVADLFSSATVAVAAVAALVSLGVIFASETAKERRLILPFMMFLMCGVNGVFMTGDIFNLFVFFEVSLLSSYALLVTRGGRLRTEAAFKYVAINVVASTFLLTGIGLLYGQLGTLNMAHLAVRSVAAVESTMVTAAAALVLVAFGIKAAVVPLHFWLPGVYRELPAGVAVFFGAMLTKLGVYSLIRVFALALPHDAELLQPILLSVGVVGVVVGALAAVAQREIRNILTWDIVSQVGYMLIPLAFFTTASVGAAIFFMLQYVPVKAALFGVAAAIEKARGTGNTYRLGGMAAGAPALAALFMIPALSLAAFPPLSGFWGKLAILQVTLNEGGLGGYAAAASVIVGGGITIFVMFRIWQRVFWGKARTAESDSQSDGKAIMPFLAPIGLAVVVAVTLAAGAAGLIDIANEAAAQLLDPTDYIAAVDLALIE